MERPRRRPGRPPTDEVGEGERREQILRAADDLFGRRGYAASSIGDVAAAVGVTKAAIYHHFPSKADLYAAAMCRTLLLIAAAVRREAASPRPVAETIYRLAEIPIVWLEDDTDMDAMMRDADEHLSPHQRAEIEAADRDRRQAMTDLMREGAARGELRRDIDPALLAHAFWHLLDGFVGRRRTVVGFEGRPETAAAVADLFLSGARARTP
jgi:AcrR family transcriptional regulator